MEEVIRSTLLADSAVAARVGGRVNWGSHPQGAAFPAVVLTVISGVSYHVLSGPSGNADGRVQVDCYAMTYGAMKGLARDVIAALDGLRSGDVLAAFHIGSRDMREGAEPDRLYRASLDFTVTYRT